MKAFPIIAAVRLYASLVFGMLFMSGSTFAQSIDNLFRSGDSWIYQHTSQYNNWNQNGLVAEGGDGEYKISVSRWNPQTHLMAVEITDNIFADAPVQHKIYGENWEELIPYNNKLHPINTPLKKPLFIGKTWIFKFRLTGDQLRSDDIEYADQEHSYIVSGIEPMIFNGVAYQVWKVERHTEVSIIGKSSSKINRSTRYAAYWYAPEIKNFIKWQDELYREDRTLKKRDTYSLKAFKLVDQFLPSLDAAR